MERQYPSEVDVLINDLVELGGLIRRRRTQNRLSQTELAERVGTTRQWVSRLEKGKNDIGTARLFAVLNALELNLDIRPPRFGSSAKALDVGTPSLIPFATVRALTKMADDDLRRQTNPNLRSVLTGLTASSDSGGLEAERRRILEASMRLSEPNADTAGRDAEEEEPGDATS